MAALGVGGFGLLTSPTSALGRVTPHHRLVRRLAPGPGRSNRDLVGLGGAGAEFLNVTVTQSCDRAQFC